MTLYATRFVEESWDADGGAVVPSPRLVVTEADSAEAAREITGLMREDFAVATDADAEEWQTLIDAPLSLRELETLIGMARRLARATGRRRLRMDPPARARANLVKVRVLNELAGKLEAMGADE